MKTALALSILPVALTAAPFSPGELPAETTAFVHLDVEAASGSKFIKSVFAPPANSRLHGTLQSALADELGVVPANDLTGITLVVLPFAGKPSSVLIAKGKFDPAKFASIPKRHPEVTENRLGSHVWYDMTELGSVFGLKHAKSVVCLLDANTALVASGYPELARVLAVHDGKSPAYSLSKEGSSTVSGSPLLCAFASEAFLKTAAFAAAKSNPDSAPQGAQPVWSLGVSAGEVDGNLRLHATAHCLNDLASKNYLSTLLSYQVQLVESLSSPVPGAGEKRLADRKLAADIVEALELSVSKENLQAVWDFPTNRLLEAFAAHAGDTVQ